MLSKAAVLLSIALATPAALFAQATPSSPTGGSTGSNTPSRPGGNTGRNNDGTTGGLNTRRSSQQPQQPQMERPIFLSGRVLLASGGVPSEPIRIVRICGVQSIPEGYTDSKGRFQFQLGGQSAMATSDASYSGPASTSNGGILSNTPFNTTRPGAGNQSGIDLTGCSLVAEAPGFRANPVMLNRVRSMDRNDVGAIILTPLGGNQGSIVSATSLAAPKKARASYDKAIREFQKGPSANSEKVVRELEDAVFIYPEYAAAWSFLGQARLESGDAAGARDALEKALEADPRYARPYALLAGAAAEQQDWQRVSEVATQALQLTPGDVPMRWLQAVSQFNLKDHDTAIDSLNSLQSDEAAARQYPQTHLVLGMIYAERGQFTDAAGEYRRYLELAPTASVVDDLKRQLYDWEQLGVL